jgi:RNA polymerase sigma factor (sigma-70 family)
MEKEFDCLSTYISLAKKTISKFGPKFYNGLSKEMLNNEEAVSDVATAIMYADWNYDEDRTGKNGQKKTKYSYRNQCAIWAIKTYITNKYKKNKKHLSLDHCLSNDDSNNSYDYISSKSLSPLETLIENEYELNLKNDIDNILQSAILSDKQREQIKMYYYDSYTLSRIGKHFGVSREAIRQSIKRGIDSIKNCVQ